MASQPQASTSSQSAEALYALVVQEITMLLDQAHQARADGRLSWSDILYLFSQFVASVVRIIEQWRGYPGNIKKAVALQFVELFYDRIIAPMDMPGVPEPLESYLVDPTLKRVLVQIASGLIDTLVAYFNQRGWPLGEIRALVKP